MRKFATALFVGAFVLGVAACGGGGGTDKVQVGKDGKKITISDGKGGANISIGGGADLPEGFPKSDVPLPSDNKSDVISGGAVTAAGTTTWSVSYKVGKDGAKAYKAKLEDAGYKADSSYSTGSGDSTSSSFYSLSNGKYNVNVIGGTDRSQSTLVITVSPNKDSSTTTTT